MTELHHHHETIHDIQTTFTRTLENAATQIASSPTVTVRQMLELVGEQGLLILCMILMLPFLLPVSVPGVSTIFSVVVILVGISIMTNWLWLPERIMNRQIETQGLVNAMHKGAKMFARIDGVIRPRLLFLTGSKSLNRLNGLAIIFAGLLLIFPLGLVPFSNTLPGLAIILLAAGMLQRDGLFILGGYMMNIISTIYFGALAVLAFMTGSGIQALLAS